jgi:hypothetical protein
LRAEKKQEVYEPYEIAAWTSQLCDSSLTRTISKGHPL